MDYRKHIYEKILEKKSPDLAMMFLKNNPKFPNSNEPLMEIIIKSGTDSTLYEALDYVVDPMQKTMLKSSIIKTLNSSICSCTHLIKKALSFMDEEEQTAYIQKIAITGASPFLEEIALHLITKGYDATPLINKLVQEDARFSLEGILSII